MRGTRKARPLACWLAALVVLAAAGPALAGSGAVMMQNAAVSCGDDSGRIYAACGNGTVTDNRTGLVWLANGACLGQLAWQEAMAVVAGLGDLPAHVCLGMTDDECDCGLADGSSPGEWRLPTMAELDAMMVAGSDADTCLPKVLNDVGNGCWDEECFALGTCAFYDIQAAPYWAASIYAGQPGGAWIGDLENGLCYPQDSAEVAFIWPVRGGQ